MSDEPEDDGALANKTIEVCNLASKLTSNFSKKDIERMLRAVGYNEGEIMEISETFSELDKVLEDLQNELDSEENGGD